MTRTEERLAAFERQTDLPMLVLSGAFVVLLVLPWVWSGASSHAALLDSIEWLIWGVFAAEFGIRVVLAPRRARYVGHHWFDAAIVVFPFLRPLRILRSIRGVALVVRFASTWKRVLLPRGTQQVLLIASGAVVVAAVAVSAAEHSASSPIEDVADALWWAVTTVTTVGYGDTYPVTAIGRGVGVALMLVGIGLFGVITANVAAYFVKEDEASHGEEVILTLRRIEERLTRLEEQAVTDRADSATER